MVGPGMLGPALVLLLLSVPLAAGGARKSAAAKAYRTRANWLGAADRARRGFDSATADAELCVGLEDSTIASTSFWTVTPARFRRYHRPCDPARCVVYTWHTAGRSTARADLCASGGAVSKLGLSGTELCVAVGGQQLTLGAARPAAPIVFASLVAAETRWITLSSGAVAPGLETRWTPHPRRAPQLPPGLTLDPEM